MRFAALEYTFLLTLIPLAALMFWAARRRTLKRVAALADPKLGERLLATISDRKAVLRVALVLLAMLLIVGALTRPQMGGRSTLVKREGIDLLFVVDVSKSMQVQDIRPSRLKRAKLELRSLIEQLSGDRVGIVSFSGAAFVQCPLTSDYAAAKMFLKSLNPKDMPVQGTAIGAALKLAGRLLTDESGTSGSRLVVLLTDGEDHGEELDQAIEQLKAAKIPVFVVGIGSASGEPVPEYSEQGDMTGYLKSKDGKTVMSRLNDNLLQSIAQKTDGQYISLQAGGSLEEMRDFVKRLQKQQFESALYTQYDEQYAVLLWPAFLLLMAATMLDERRKSRFLGLRS
jgi:Ca-activated chloride channel family protein